MHTLEPFYNWRDKYIAAEDELSPFFGTDYDEFAFTRKIYNYLIHPQWDDMGSETLFLKVLFVDYDEQFAVIEFIGEWNDCISNDIMTLKRDVIDTMIQDNINKFILIGENILTFHGEEEDYYAEWQEEVSEEGGFIVCLNLQEHVLEEMQEFNIQHHIFMGERFNSIIWRTLKPSFLLKLIEDKLFNNLLE